MIRSVVIFQAIICVFGRDVGVSTDNDFIRVSLVSKDHSRIRRAVPVSNGNKIELTNDKNLHYGFPITVGTPPQNFVMNLDTGSSDIWVPSVNCESPALCKSINKYNATASSSHKEAAGSPTFGLGYKVGGLTGLRAMETVSFAGMTIKDQIIGEALSEPVDSYNYPFDGTFGFGWNVISATDQNSTPLDNLYEQGKIKNRIFCVKLNQLGTTPGGELIIGGCDIEADYWKPLSVSGFWQIKMTSIVVGPSNGDQLTLCASENGCEAMFDTGMAITGGPPDQINEIAAKIGAQYNETYQTYVIPCNATNLPNIDYQFGEVKITLMQEDYVAPWWGDKCSIGLTRMDVKYQKADYLLGDPFLRKLTVIYDKDNKRLGFANIK